MRLISPFIPSRKLPSKRGRFIRGFLGGAVVGLVLLLAVGSVSVFGAAALLLLPALVFGIGSLDEQWYYSMSTSRWQMMRDLGAENKAKESRHEGA